MENETFSYTYSASRQEEIDTIRKKYLPQEEDKMEQLRRLDQSTTQKGSIAALAVGIISVLVFGTGMCCCLVWKQFLPGVLIGLIGVIGLALAYPLYTRITQRERERIAPDIIRLTDELKGDCRI